MSRKRGRPVGARDMHGKANRFDPRHDRAYAAAIGKRLNIARVERDVSAYELGLAAGIAPSFVYKIERGEHCPLAKTICRLAVALGMSPSELMP